MTTSAGYEAAVPERSERTDVATYEPAGRARSRCAHTEHTIGMTGRFLGRASAHAPAVGGGWEQCLAGPHHEHQVGHGDDGDAECCICPGAPCGAVTVDDMLAHATYDRTSAERWGQIHARLQISDEITKALDSLPEDSLCEAAAEVFRTCWVIARGNIDQPPF